MATTLDQYYLVKEKNAQRITAGELPMEHLLQYQELLYRISVFESCKSIVQTAPVNADTKAMVFHYQVADALITSMLTERQFGIPADEKLKKQRETAFGNFQTVVNHFRKAFKGFAPTTSGAYRDAIQKMINTVLPAWLQYRYTFIPF